MTTDKSLKDFCITKMVGFTYHPILVDLVSKWILEYNFHIFVPSFIMGINLDDEHNQIENENFENLINVNLKMSIYHKYYFVKSLCASEYLDDDKRNQMMNLVFED